MRHPDLGLVRKSAYRWDAAPTASVLITLTWPLVQKFGGWSRLVKSLAASRTRTELSYRGPS
jgi:hypothetical protein